jgi:hypothetical protein
MRTITGPWTFGEHMYGIAHCLSDRDGRVIGCNLPIGNGPLLEQRRRWRRSSASSSPACRRSSYAPAPPKCSIGSMPGELESRAKMTSKPRIVDSAASRIIQYGADIAGASAGVALEFLGSLRDQVLFPQRFWRARSRSLAPVCCLATRRRAWVQSLATLPTES